MENVEERVYYRECIMNNVKGRVYTGECILE